MLILSLDTASPFPSLAIGGGDGPERIRPLPPNAAESLPIALEALLADAGRTVRDLAGSRCCPARALSRDCARDSRSRAGSRGGAAFLSSSCPRSPPPTRQGPSLRTPSSSSTPAGATCTRPCARGAASRTRCLRVRGPRSRPAPPPGGVPSWISGWKTCRSPSPPGESRRATRPARAPLVYGRPSAAEEKRARLEAWETG